MSDIYISSSGVLTAHNPDILPETSLGKFLGSAPSVCRRVLAPGVDGKDFEGTVLAGKFKTNDDRNDPSILFITAYREGPSDGAGVDTFSNGYGVAVMPLNSKSAADNRLNIFVVDNSLAVPRVVLENVVHTGWGEMPYLAAVSETLNPDTSYNFELHFLAGGGLRYFQAPEGSLLGPPKITYGAYQHKARGTYYGVSISYNEGKKWSLDNLSLVHLGKKHVLHQYLLDATPFSSGFVVRASAYSSGYNDALPGVDYGVVMKVWNYLTGVWDDVDDHDNGPGGGSFALSSAFLAKNEYASPADNYIRVALVGKHPSDYDEGVDSFLHVDEVMAENWSTLFGNVGGMGDIHVHESALPTQHTIDMYDVGAEEWLIKSNSKIVGDLLLPMPFVVLVNTIDAMGNVIGTLVEGIDYSIQVRDSYRRFSADERNTIVFAGGGGVNVRITYLSFANIGAIQNYVSTPPRANFADDLLAFVKAPWEFFVVLDYRGSKPRAEVRTELVNWIMGVAGNSFDDHDIESFLQTLDGVSNVRVVSMTIRKHRPDGSSEDETAASFTLEDYRAQQFMTLDDATHIAFTPESD